ncbi:MAG: hypothetical protein EBT09_00395, partial [Actinobacteria bacterium]|nr:hypothetical protein [Actinomycetota bacterium]
GNASSGNGNASSGNGNASSGNGNASSGDGNAGTGEDHSAPDGGSWANYNSYDNQQARANAAAAALAAAQQQARDNAAAAGSGSATQIGGGYWQGGVTGGTWISTNAEGGVATRATLGIFGEAGSEALIPLERLPEMVAAIGGSRSGGRWGDPGDRSEPGGYGGRDTGTQVTINTTVNLQGADFSDPQFINRLSRSVGDAIMEKVRMGGLGRVS